MLIISRYPNQQGIMGTYILTDPKFVNTFTYRLCIKVSTYFCLAVNTDLYEICGLLLSISRV